MLNMFSKKNKKNIFLMSMKADTTHQTKNKNKQNN